MGGIARRAATGAWQLPISSTPMYGRRDRTLDLFETHPFILGRTIAMLGDTLRDATHDRLVREVEAERLIENHLRERAGEDGRAPCRPAELPTRFAMNVSD